MINKSAMERIIVDYINRHNRVRRNSQWSGPEAIAFSKWTRQWISAYTASVERLVLTKSYRPGNVAPTQNVTGTVNPHA